VTVQAPNVIGEGILHEVIHEHARCGCLCTSNEIEHGRRGRAVLVVGFASVVIGRTAIVTTCIQTKDQWRHGFLALLVGRVALLGSLALTIIVVNQHGFIPAGIEAGRIGELIQIATIIHVGRTGATKVSKLGGIAGIDAEILEDHLPFAQCGGYLQ